MRSLISPPGAQHQYPESGAKPR